MLCGIYNRSYIYILNIHSRQLYSTYRIWYYMYIHIYTYLHNIQCVIFIYDIRLCWLYFRCRINMYICYQSCRHCEYYIWYLQATASAAYLFPLDAEVSGCMDALMTVGWHSQCWLILRVAAEASCGSGQYSIDAHEVLWCLIDFHR